MKNMLKKTKFLQEEEPMRFVIQRVTYASVSVNQKTKETCAIVQSGEFGTNIKAHWKMMVPLRLFLIQMTSVRNIVSPAFQNYEALPRIPAMALDAHNKTPAHIHSLCFLKNLSAPLSLPPQQ